MQQQHQQSGALCNAGAGRGFGMRELAPGGSARPPATGEQVVAAQVLTSSSSSSSSSCFSCPPPAHFSHCPPAPKLFAQELPNFLLHHLPTFPSKLPTCTNHWSLALLLSSTCSIIKLLPHLICCDLISTPILDFNRESRCCY